MIVTFRPLCVTSTDARSVLMFTSKVDAAPGASTSVGKAIETGSGELFMCGLS
jgi:hypothetical protein